MRPQRETVWPVAKDGFRLRGLAVTRLEAFTDAAFAFALTLLVISIDAVPTTYSELLSSMAGVPAFAVSFILLLLFWYGHWEWSRRFGLEDGPTIVLSATLIFTVLVYVYPLKFMMSALSWWLSGRRLGLARLEDVDELYSVFFIYGIGFTAMAASLIGLNLYALRRREVLRLDDLEIVLTRAEITVWCVLASSGLLSCILAIVMPASPAGVPGFAYWLIPLAMPVALRIVGRERRRLHRELRGDAADVDLSTG
jgi:hypothetical protein